MTSGEGLFYKLISLATKSQEKVYFDSGGSMSFALREMPWSSERGDETRILSLTKR